MTCAPVTVAHMATHSPAQAGPWWRASPYLWAGVVCCVLGGVMSGTPIDHELSTALHETLAAWPAFWSLLSWSALGVTCLMIASWFSLQDPRRLICLLWCILIGGALVHLIKHLVDVPRPLLWFELQHLDFQPIGERLHRRSMPSGHTACAWATAVIMWQSTARGMRARGPWMLLWGVLASLQGLSRIVVGAHWCSDVLVGAGIALLVTPLIWRSALTQGATQRLWRRPVRQLIALGLVVAALSTLLGAATPAFGQAWSWPVHAMTVLVAWLWWRGRPWKWRTNTVMAQAAPLS